MSTPEVFGGEGWTQKSDRTRALVLGPYLTDRAAVYADGAKSLRGPEARLDEAEGLALAIDVEIVGRELALLSQIRPATYLGKGKVDEFAALVKEREADLVVVDCALSPVQQRNLEKAFAAKVIDRTGLILEIFGERARTREGALQVELAHLSYQKSRLVRSWTHLERQRGGFGFLGGPGETQIETDRRLIQERMTRIERDLDQVKRTRGLHRKSRREVPFPIVALVGYTNAGKSSLFNRLTKAEVFAKDLLFATLDPTLRGLKLPHGGKIILSDTVGFISDLPHMLVSAFRATLEEVLEADVILHVRDISHEDAEAQGADVEKILAELGIDPHDSPADRGLEQGRPAAAGGTRQAARAGRAKTFGGTSLRGLGGHGRRGEHSARRDRGAAGKRSRAVRNLARRRRWRGPGLALRPYGSVEAAGFGGGRDVSGARARGNARPA